MIKEYKQFTESKSMCPPPPLALRYEFKHTKKGTSVQAYMYRVQIYGYQFSFIQLFWLYDTDG